MGPIAPDPALLTITAAWIGFIHTLLGPDHHPPCVALSACAAGTIVLGL